MGKISTNLGVFVTSLFVTALAVYIYSPVLGSHADTSKQTDINLSVNSTIALRTNMDTLNLSANVGSFVNTPLSIDVATNSQYGYTLTLEDKDDNTDMAATNASVADVVESNFSGAKTSAEMADNTWGFSLDETSYYQIPVNGSPVALKRTNSSMNGEYETTTVDFGAKVGMLLTAGTYEDVVVFTAYVNGQDGNPADGTTPGNPGEISYGPTTMQGFTCSETHNIGDVFTLTDARDGNTYTVKKLRDGKCWMTDNLRLGKDTPITLTPSDSDVVSSFTLPAAPETMTSSDFSAFDTANVYIDSTYGGYYNWYTATAGEGTRDYDSSFTEHSICPKGWKLPVGYTDGDFWHLYYDYYDSVAALLDEPNFKLGGYISYGTIAGNGQGSYARYWSSSNTNSDYAASLYIASNDVMPSNSYPKRYGHSVRCLAR